MIKKGQTWKRRDWVGEDGKNLHEIEKGGDERQHKITPREECT